MPLSESTTGEVDCASLPRFNFPSILCIETGEPKVKSDRLVYSEESSTPENLLFCLPLPFPGFRALTFT
jgi:hypothetical protein